MNNENMQKTRMCIRTYINLYGTAPGIPEMIEWTGLTYEEVLPAFMAELEPKACKAAA